MADFLTIDVFYHPVRHTPARRRMIRAALAERPEGLRAHTINYANTGTFTLIPRPVGTCLLLAWESSDAAHTAWHGRLGAALGRAGDYRLDGEIARARTEHADDHWHGWHPADDGAAPIRKDEPMVVLVHGSRAPALSDHLPARQPPRRQPCAPPPRPSRQHRRPRKTAIREHVDQHLDQSRLRAGLRLQTGGHAPAMKRGLSARYPSGRRSTSRSEPLASTGNLGIDQPALPDLPGRRPLNAPRRSAAR